MANQIFYWRPLAGGTTSGTVNLCPPDPTPAPGMETTACKRFLYRTLSQSTAVTTALGGTAIYETLAPQGAAMPYIVYQVQGNATEFNAAGDSISGIPLFGVKVVSEGQTFQPADDIMKVVLPLLEGASGTVTGFKMSCFRVAGIDYPEITRGKRYNHLGAVYRFQVEGTA